MKKQIKDYIFQEAKRLRQKPKRAKAEEVKPLPPKKGRARGVITRLEYLNPGERFEFVNLDNMFRNLYVKRSSECSISIAGEIFDEEDKEWVRLPQTYLVAPSCKVRVI